MKWYQRLITRLYIKLVLIPMSKKLDGMEYSFDIEFVPADELIAEVESKEATKH